MGRFAKGKRSRAISDRSGFEVPYTQLKTTWNNLRVEPEEFEVKHPRLTPPKNIIDPTALFDPRPNNDPENVSIFFNFNWFNNAPTGMQATQYKKPNLPVGKGSVGFPSFEIENTSISGIAGTGAIGTETPEASINETGVAGTGETGTEVVEASITETGLSGTGEIGTVSVIVNPEWGTGTWGSGVWGQ